MCYICNSSYGHEIGWPFAKAEKVKYLVCRDCGEEIAEHEAYEIEGDTCQCDSCYFGWGDE